MAYKQFVKDQVREAFISGLSLSSAAARFGVPYDTARRWKEAARKAGDRWDSLVLANKMADSNENNLAQQTLDQFLTIYHETLKDIQNDPDMSNQDKVKLLASLANTYRDVTRTACKVDPTSWELALAMDVTKSFMRFVKERYPEKIKDVLSIHYEFSRTIAEQYGKK